MSQYKICNPSSVKNEVNKCENIENECVHQTVKTGFPWVSNGGGGKYSFQKSALWIFLVWIFYNGIFPYITCVTKRKNYFRKTKKHFI